LSFAIFFAFSGALLLMKKYIPHYNELLKLAMPLVLTQAGQVLVQLIDNAMVGHFGTAELAAASFAGNIYLVIMLLGLGMFMGVTPLVGHARGAQNDSHVAATMKSGCVLAALLVPVVGLISYSIAWIMPYMGQSDDVVRLAVPYYRSLVVSIVPFLFFVLLKQIGEGLGNTSLAMVVTIVTTLIKIVLNYALIFGKMGFPEMGLTGAGYSTIVSRITMPLLLYVGFMCFKPIRHYFVLMRTIKSASQEVFNILRIGLPISVQLTLEVFSFTVSAVMMGWLGNVSLASHEIAIGLAGFTFMAANGVALATTIRVSYQLGAQDCASIGTISYSAVHLTLIFMGFCGLGFFLFQAQLPHIFTSDAQVIKQTASLLAIAALFQLFDGLQVTCLGILRGFADVKAPMFISVFSYMVVGLSVSYFCAFSLNLGPEGIWFGFLAGLIVAGSLLILRVRKRIRGVTVILHHV
jgi:multidrug resistance protein, MATE family